MKITQERLLILDFGSQYTSLIARRVRELRVYAEIKPYHLSEESLYAFNPKGIILSGGPETVLSTETPRVPSYVFKLGCPILGICYGMQTMAAQLGGEVESALHHEFGLATLTIVEHAGLFQHITEREIPVWMSHGDRVAVLPPGFEVVAATANTPIAAMADTARRWYGVQFHPEVTHTPQGMDILRYFVREVCTCPALWTMDHILEELKQNLRHQLGDDHVILGLSGGVDSAVVAVLLHEVIAERLVCVFIDTGLLRQGEVDEVTALFNDHLGIPLTIVDAKSAFLSALRGVTDPEEKRKVIGRLFIEMFEAEARRFLKVRWLAQGTIYPDVIESAANSDQAHVIKSHHNVGGLPERLSLGLVEPLRNLFKDEVRELGMKLGLSRAWVYRHPFPGPGLAVRILGEVRAEYVTILQKADAIFIEELRREGWYEKVAQAFVVFLPVKAVGVVGDARKYEYVVTLRAVETTDFMTAEWVPLPADFLGRVSRRLMNEIREVARVCYDISSKPPATIEWE